MHEAQILKFYFLIYAKARKPFLFFKTHKFCHGRFTNVRKSVTQILENLLHDAEMLDKHLMHDVHQLENLFNYGACLLGNVSMHFEILLFPNNADL